MKKGVYQVNAKKMLCGNLAKKMCFVLNVHILYISVNNRQLLKYNFTDIKNVRPYRNNF